MLDEKSFMELTNTVRYFAHSLVLRESRPTVSHADLDEGKPFRGLSILMYSEEMTFRGRPLRCPHRTGTGARSGLDTTQIHLLSVLEGRGRTSYVVYTITRSTNPLLGLAEPLGHASFLMCLRPPFWSAGIQAFRGLVLYSPLEVQGQY